MLFPSADNCRAHTVRSAGDDVHGDERAARAVFELEGAVEVVEGVEGVVRPVDDLRLAALDKGDLIGLSGARVREVDDDDFVP